MEVLQIFGLRDQEIGESRTLNSNYNLYLVKILQLLFLDKN